MEAYPFAHAQPLLPDNLSGSQRPDVLNCPSWVCEEKAAWPSLTSIQLVSLHFTSPSPSPRAHRNATKVRQSMRWQASSAISKNRAELLFGKQLLDFSL